MTVIQFPIRKRNDYTEAAVEQHLYDVAEASLDLIAEAVVATARTPGEVRAQMVAILDKLTLVADDLRNAEID
jgi:hypothetical protein